MELVSHVVWYSFPPPENKELSILFDRIINNYQVSLLHYSQRFVSSFCKISII